MHALVLAFAITGAINFTPDGLPVAPLDIVAGSQEVSLREPLVARTRGARLVLLMRGRALDASGADAVAAFEAALPRGSVTAHLRNAAGEELVLEHTGYAYHRGYAGLLLTSDANPHNARYDALELDADRALPNVRVVWLERAAQQLQDLRQLP